MQIAGNTLDVELIEFDLKYRKDGGDPRRIFQSMVKLIDATETTGKLFLKGVDPALTFQLGVQETRAGSLITKVFGMVTGKDGKRLPKEQEAVLTKGIAEANKEVMRAQQKLDNSGHADEKDVAEKIAVLQKESATAYSHVSGKSVPIFIEKPVSEKQMRSVMASLATGAFMLDTKDSVGITIGAESFGLNQSLKPYQSEIAVAEITQEVQTTIDAGAGPKLIRVVTPRYETPKGWEIIHDNRVYKTEIMHKEWFERIHDQLDEVGPKDQLMVDAEFELKRMPSGKLSARCRVKEVISVKKFHPEDAETLEDLGASE